MLTTLYKNEIKNKKNTTKIKNIVITVLTLQKHKNAINSYVCLLFQSYVSLNAS